MLESEILPLRSFWGAFTERFELTHPSFPIPWASAPESLRRAFNKVLEIDRQGESVPTHLNLRKNARAAICALCIDPEATIELIDFRVTWFQWWH